jgi:hypothetical protein
VIKYKTSNTNGEEEKKMNRNKMTRWFSLILALAAMGLFLGCGGGGGGGGKPNNSTAIEDTSLTATDSGVLTDTETTISTVGAEGSGESNATVVVPANTVGDLADERPATGEITTTVTASDYDSVATFPGSSFNVTIDGGDYRMDPAGFVDVKMFDADGNRLKTFSPPLQISFTIVDPAVELGDVLELWRWDDDTGWIFMQDITVEELAGGLGVSFETSTLSAFNGNKGTPVPGETGGTGSGGGT